MKNRRLVSPPDDPHDPSQQQVESFLVDPDFFPDGEGAREVALDEGQNPPEKLVHQTQPSVHGVNI